MFSLLLFSETSKSTHAAHHLDANWIFGHGHMDTNRKKNKTGDGGMYVRCAHISLVMSCFSTFTSPQPAKTTNARSFRNLSAAASAARELLFICEDRKAVKHLKWQIDRRGRVHFTEDAYLRGKMREGQCYSTAKILGLCVCREVAPFSVILSRKVDCDVTYRC